MIGLLAAFVCACAADAGNVEGAISLAVRACANGDAEALYKVIDQRSRHALEAIVKARARAEDEIVRAYPARARDEALRALGDARGLERGAELFERRCGAPCMAELGAKLGAVSERHGEGQLVHVKTVMGGEVELWRGEDDRYGLVWNTDALSRERTRAFAELSLVEQNAKLYEKRRALE